MDILKTPSFYHMLENYYCCDEIIKAKEGFLSVNLIQNKKVSLLKTDIFILLVWRPSLLHLRIRLKKCKSHFLMFFNICEHLDRIDP